MRRSLGRSLWLLAGLLLPTSSHGADSTAKLLAGWVALDAPIGHEHLATDRLLQQLPGWQLDRNGNLYRKVGAGSPRRVVACGLDSPAYAITQIRQDGYLRLHRIGGGSRHPLWDQAHEGQQVRVLTSSGAVVGVIAIANGHFAPQHRHQTSVVTADDLWLDVGASSAESVASLGIRLLDPVVRHLPPWSFAGEVAGPGAGARVGCAAVVAASQGGVRSGETVFVISTQQAFGQVGFGAMVARLGTEGPLARATFVGPGEIASLDHPRRLDFHRRLAPVLERAGLEQLRWLAPEVRDPGALMERVTVAEAESLLSRVLEAAGVSPEERPAWLPAPAPAAFLESAADSVDDETWGTTATLLKRLVEAPGVSGHERPVRRIVLEQMPNWAREQAQIDDLGNLWLDLGPADQEATIFLAHLDEVGFEIQAIANDGTLHLRARGGVVASAWEGQPARLQLKPPSSSENGGGSGAQLDGVFLTRSEPRKKRPEELSAWFGLDSKELAELGVRVGLAVTGYKEGHRIGKYRFTARALDDRAGTTALLRALHRLDPAELEQRVIFAWSVQEETGLVGAAALAKRFGAETRRAFSIDTFVSSDTPLESPHFAHTPLGDGPVLRAIESSGMAPPSERQRIPELASTAGLHVQVGLTQGGTDGTTFTFWGAPNAGLSWPGRYSHSPAEVLDLRDLIGLTDLIILLVKDSS